MYLSLQRVSKTFHGERPVQALAEVSFVIEQGEFVSLIGQSGSGKSTLCNLIAGLLTPDSGEILAEWRPDQRPDRPCWLYAAARSAGCPGGQCCRT